MSMFDLDNWNEIWVTITRNKLRSILTGFGVFWGIFMLVILIGGGNSFMGGLSAKFEGFASNSTFYSSGVTSEPYKGYRKGRSWNINNRDLELIKDRATTIEYISPNLFYGGGDKNVVNGQKSGSYLSRGVYGEYFFIEGQHILSGRLFNQLDIEEKRKVCVIGKQVYETLFERNEVAEGKYIRVNGVYFQVIGVISPRSDAQIGGNAEETVFLPFTTMQLAFNQGDVVHFVACTTKRGYDAEETVEEVTQILKASHSISPTDEKAVWSMNASQQFKIFDLLFLGVSILIWFVGMSTLLSGMIGISNIMVVTVRERTREIGVRRALGAKPKTILVQILSESFVLTFLAGILGLFAGIAALEIISYAMQDYFMDEANIFIEPFVSFNVAIISLVILLFAGIIAGIMPANRALKIKAIEALRDE